MVSLFSIREFSSSFMTRQLHARREGFVITVQLSVILDGLSNCCIFISLQTLTADKYGESFLTSGRWDIKSEALFSKLPYTIININSLSSADHNVGIYLHECLDCSFTCDLSLASILHVFACCKPSRFFHASAI